MNDCEDHGLNRLVKVALESRARFEVRRPQTASHWLKWSVPTLLAASLAALILSPAMRPTAMSSLVDTIALLSDVEEVDLKAIEQRSPAELLLAWQDLPYVDCWVGGDQ